MKHTTSTVITKSNQVTVPARAKRLMGIRPGIRLEVSYDQDSITYRVPKYAFEDVFASVPARPGPDSDNLDAIIRASQDEHLAEERRKLDEP